MRRQINYKPPKSSELVNYYKWGIKIIIMRKLFLTAMLLFGCIFSFASVGKSFSKKIKIVEGCSITVTKYCEGSGTTISTTKTSSDGNCYAAYYVANEQWQKDCSSATILKYISED